MHFNLSDSNGKISIHSSEESLLQTDQHTVYFCGTVFNLPEIQTQYGDLQKAFVKKPWRELRHDLIGSFFFVVIDKQTKEIAITVDQMGDAYLFWSMANGLTVSTHLNDFAQPDTQLNRDWIERYFLNQPGGFETPLSGVNRLGAGMSLTFLRGQGANVENYFDLTAAAIHAREHEERIPIEQAQAELKSILTTSLRSVEQQYKRLGLCFSSGVDSITEIALCKELGLHPHLLTRHHNVTSPDAARVLDNISNQARDAGFERTIATMLVPDALDRVDGTRYLQPDHWNWKLLILEFPTVVQEALKLEFDCLIKGHHGDEMLLHRHRSVVLARLERLQGDPDVRRLRQKIETGEIGENDPPNGPASEIHKLIKAKMPDFYGGPQTYAFFPDEFHHRAVVRFYKNHGGNFARHSSLEHDLAWGYSSDRDFRLLTDMPTVSLYKDPRLLPLVLRLSDTDLDDAMMNARLQSNIIAQQFTEPLFAFKSWNDFAARPANIRADTLRDETYIPDSLIQKLEGALDRVRSFNLSSFGYYQSIVEKAKTDRTVHDAQIRMLTFSYWYQNFVDSKSNFHR